MTLLTGTCIILFNLPWRIQFQLQDHVALGYPIESRTMLTKTVEKSFYFKESLFIKQYVEKNAKKIKCPKNY